MMMLPEVKMDLEGKMTIEERYQYLRRMKKRYQKANRQERSRLLDEEEWFHCSSLLGYDRLDTVAQTLLLNQIYQKVWV